VKVGELFVELGIHSDMQKLNEFVSGMQRGVIESASFIAGLVGISMTLKDIVMGAIDTAASMRTFRNTTGLSTIELQKWQMAGEKVGIKAETMQANIESLNKTLNDVKYGKAPPEGFMFLGLKTSLNAFQTMLSIREKIEGMDKTRATSLLSSMGISPEMMNLLLLSDSKFKAAFPRSDELAMTQLQEEMMNKMIGDLTSLKQEWDNLTRDLLTITLPALISFVKLLGDSIGRLPESFKTIKEEFSSIEGPMRLLKDLFKNTFIGFGANLGTPQTVGFNMMRGGSNSNTNNVNVNIHTSADPSKDLGFNKHIWDTVLSLEGSGGAS
jgi:hypothetical protein